MMRMAGWMLAPAAMVVAVPAVAQDAAVRALVDRFEAARAAYDPAALATTLAPSFEEISPIGTVDGRDAVLGFYAPDKKTPAPPMTDDEVAVQTSGDTALVTLRKRFAIPGGPTRAIRVRYVAQRMRGRWQLLSAQYTPIPPAR
jgi:uncharacterized protein (TIGR02246 family)